MKEIKVTEDQFIKIYTKVVMNKIPFTYKFNGCSQECGRNPQVLLYPRYDRNEFTITFNNIDLYKTIWSEIK